MKRLIVMLAVALACPVAAAQGLSTAEILQNIEGSWGGAGESPDGKDHSCQGHPTRIWLEDNGTVYKSQSGHSTKVLVSKVGLPDKTARTHDFILVSYSNHPQRGPFGLQVVWALRMPDRDHFYWQQFPGPTFPMLERCGGPEVG
jgi:hypothetical protein